MCPKNVDVKRYTNLLNVKNLTVTFNQFKQGLRETTIKPIRHFNLTVQKGDIVAIVGASGAGKSLLADAILGILPKHAKMSGEIIFNGEQLTEKKQDSLRGYDIFLIPQSIQALDPLMKVGKQVETIINRNGNKTTLKQIFELVGLRQHVAHLYPFQLSGGMARRILISIAIASDAQLIVADESTPGLDERVKNDTIQLLKKLAIQGKGIIFITHDILAAVKVAHHITIVYNGETIETTDVENFTGLGEKLIHPYTKQLWNSLPENKFTSPLLNDN